ncbi:hypothetical protein F4802DRAFT_559150 [Xylaria palmicola]|nr:hypothetical protein F4802DRAFT_559150 [Xylaria palmicola]
MSAQRVDVGSSPTGQPQTDAVPESRSVQWGARLLNATLWFWTIVLFTFVAFTTLVFWPVKEPDLSITHDFGIGFDLSPSYATVAVSYPNGSVQPIARVEGNGAYREMMLRLSLPSSRRIHRPYDDMGEVIGDIPRQMWRRTLMKFGIAPSRDVGTLRDMIHALRDDASSFVGEPVSAAAISIPHLTALYGDDLHDAFELLSLIYLEFYRFWSYRPIRTTIAAYAGNGWGLCRDYRNATACREEYELMRHQYALAVEYTHTGLLASQADVGAANWVEEIPAREDLRLGYDARDEASYWERVREMLLSPVVDSAILRNITMVIVSGDAAEKPRFREVLAEVIDDVAGVPHPEILDRDPEFSAAKGTAELAKRAIFEQVGERDPVSEL